eukprot:4037052-Ditylum_brightwellii.AAC.2
MGQVIYNVALDKKNRAGLSFSIVWCPRDKDVIKGPLEHTVQKSFKKAADLSSKNEDRLVLNSMFFGSKMSGGTVSKAITDRNVNTCLIFNGDPEDRDWLCKSLQDHLCLIKKKAKKTKTGKTTV